MALWVLDPLRGTLSLHSGLGGGRSGLLQTQPIWFCSEITAQDGLQREPNGMTRGVWGPLPRPCHLLPLTLHESIPTKHTDSGSVEWKHSRKSKTDLTHIFFLLIIISDLQYKVKYTVQYKMIYSMYCTILYYVNISNVKQCNAVLFL